MGLLGQSLYRWKALGRQLTDESAGAIELYPPILRESLQDPFGKKRSFFWIYFGNLGASDDVKMLSRRLENRNQDLLNIVSSLIFVIFLRFIVSMFENFNVGFVAVLLGHPWNMIRDTVIEMTVQSTTIELFLVLTIPILLYGYIMLIRQSILTVVELDVIERIRVTPSDDNPEEETVL